VHPIGEKEKTFSLLAVCEPAGRGNVEKAFFVLVRIERLRRRRFFVR
jgi:hypothetical protein